MSENSSSRAFIERPRGSCALAGAMTTITALPRGIPILHAAPGCAGNAAWTQLGGGGLQVGGYCGSLSVACSNIQEREVVFGGDQRLREQIEHTFKVLDGDLYVIASGCVPAMIGDDVKAVASEFIDSGKPLIVAATSGFKGNTQLGYDLVLEAIARQFVKKGIEKHKGKVNLLGIVPNWDVFWRGNIVGVKQLLQSLGLEVNAYFSHEDTMAEIANSSAAELNIVVSGAYGILAARAYEEVHGIPWLSLPLPIGPAASAEFLKTVGHALGISGNKINSQIHKAEDEYYHYVSTLSDCYSDMDLQRYAVIIGDANYAAALPRFLADDLGWLPELTVCTEDLDVAAQYRVKAAINLIESELRPELVFDSDTARLPEFLERRHPRDPEDNYYQDPLSPAIVIGSSLDRTFAASIGAAHLSVSFPVANRAVLDRGYTGYAGGLRLIEDLLGAIVLGR
ncbi:MAG: nitrogenase component 1 [Lentisphaerota bacterium]